MCVLSVCFVHSSYVLRACLMCALNVRVRSQCLCMCVNVCMFACGYEFVHMCTCTDTQNASVNIYL